MITVAMMACPRGGWNYENTLESMSDGDCEMVDTHIYWDRNDPSPQYLELLWNPLTTEEEEQQSRRSNEQRACYTAYRCFSTPPSPLSRGLAVIEDDLEFSKTWHKRLLECIEIADRNIPGQRYTLLGYERHPVTWTEGSKMIEHGMDHSFVFSYWPAAMVPMAQAVLLKALNHPTEKAAADIALASLCLDEKIRMLTVVPSLVQHMGDSAVVNPKHGIRKSPIYVG